MAVNSTSDNEISDNELSDKDLSDESFDENPNNEYHISKNHKERLHDSYNYDVTPKDRDCASYINIRYLGIFLMILIPLISYINSYWYDQKRDYISDLKDQFPNQPSETWNYFEAVIDDILINTHPAVFLFLYDDNKAKVNSLIHHLAEYASYKLNTNKNYIDVNGDEFHTNEAKRDYGYLIDKYKSELLEKHVMVVKDIQNIPAHVAQVFHSFCDEISPLVERVVYLFTLKVDSVQGKEEYIAEKSLEEKWKSLDNDLLMPLITRITGTVLKVANDT